MSKRSFFARAVVAAFATCMLAATPALAESTGEGSEETNAAVLSPLAFAPMAQPDPVLGSDDKVHLAYEMQVMNASRASVTLTSVETLDATKDDAVLGTMDAETLPGMLNLSGGVQGTTMPPGGSGYLFFDVQLDPSATVPSSLLHHFVMTVASGEGQTSTIEYDGVPVKVHSRAKAVVVAPPLKGSGWVVGNGCCAPINAHRGATLSVNGTADAAERFAIDFVQLGPNSSLVQGDATKNESFGYYGDEIYAAAAGKVVAIQDDQPTQLPGVLPPGQTVQTAGGNYVVVDIGKGRYAFYAHMQPGSLEVKLGDAVKTGQVLGLLGNTGNTDGAHLHFHIMDGPSPLLSNGLPFVFTQFTGEGRVTDGEALQKFEVTPVDTSALTGTHENEMPLNLEVVTFE
jgi:peptidase M23-like protein